MRTEIITTDDTETLIRCHVRGVTPKSIITTNLDGEKIYLSSVKCEIVNTEFDFTEILVPNWLAESTGIL